MRACFYARVSTEEEKQADALVIQCQELREFIAEMGWKLVREYVDEGKSGTTTKKRDEYRSLYNDLGEDIFDVVVIKSQDRLMRSAKDWYTFLSRMVDYGKKLYFYIDRKFYQSDDSLITGIKAILAEDYSRELSKKINNATRTRQKNGSSIITNGFMWGFEQKDGELIVIPKEAELIRRIFNMYASGMGARRIKATLDEEGVVSRRGTKIGLTTLKRMIANPIYYGTVVQNKLHFDFDTKKLNRVEEKDWVRHENRVEPIVSKELWDRANEQRIRNTTSDGAVRRGIKRGSFPLSSKVRCGDCGAVYHHAYRIFGGGEKLECWVCGTYQNYGRKHPKGKPARTMGCDNPLIRQDLLDEIFARIAENYEEDFVRGLHVAMKAIASAISSGAAEKEIGELRQRLGEIEHKKELLLDNLLDGTISKEMYGKRNSKLEDDYKTLTEKIAKLEEAEKKRGSIENRLKQIRKEIEETADKKARIATIMAHVECVMVYVDKVTIKLDMMKDLIEAIPYTNENISMENRYQIVSADYSLM